MVVAESEIVALGDLGMIVPVCARPGGDSWREVQLVASTIEAAGFEEVEEVVPALNVVAVYLKRTAGWHDVARRIVDVLADGEAPDAVEEGRERVIRVGYGGESGADLERVAAKTGLSSREVIERHTAGRYRVLALGFAPGFAYLDGLDPSLWCPRLDVPRTRVDAGAVGIGGGQTGVYPVALPGGWNLIGRTGRRLFDPQAVPPNWLNVGDTVKFVEADDDEVAACVTGREAGPETGAGGIEVLDPGLQTTVQDTGRAGYQSIGVPEGGAVDRRSMIVANLLVMNDRDMAGLEWALRGPKLLFRERRVVAVTGAGAVGVPLGKPFVVEANEVLDLTRLRSGFRGYLAIEGGLSVDGVLGARGTDLAGGFGGWCGRALEGGDVLPVGEGRIESVERGWWAAPQLAGRAADGVVRVRVVRGPEVAWFGEDGWDVFLGSEYEVGSASNRMGTRLAGAAVVPLETREMVSQPVAAGTVQVPAGGQPIVMLADRQSLGGYPRIATVVSTDVGLLAQVAPGGRVRFVACELDEAQALRLEEDRDVSRFASAIRNRFRTSFT